MKILCVGDVSLDTYSPSGESFFGGCSLNVARQLYEKIGHNKTSLYSPLGTDLNSIKAQEYLEERGMEVRVKIIQGDCPRQPILIDENGERHLHDYHDGVLPEFTCSDLGNFFLAQYGMVLFPFYKQVEPMAQSLFNLNLKAKLGCDFGNLSDWGGDLKKVNELLPKLNYAQFSSDSPIKEREEYFKNASLDRDLTIVDTHGVNGASAYRQGKVYYIDAPKVLQITDTTGAGDAFFAHFVFSYFVEQASTEESLRFACEGGSTQVSHLGPGPL